MFVAALLSEIQRAVLDNQPPPDITISMRHMATAVRVFSAGIEQLDVTNAPP